MKAEFKYTDRNRYTLPQLFKIKDFTNIIILGYAFGDDSIKGIVIASDDCQVPPGQKTEHSTSQLERLPIGFSITLIQE